MEIAVRPLLKSDWDAVSNIYREGIATGMATFETVCPDWNQWHKKYLTSCRIVALYGGDVVGFGVLAPVSKRAVYKGVAEVSVYVSPEFWGKQIGETVLRTLIEKSESEGLWTLQASIFSENKASINLHVKCGFRIVGIRQKIGQLNGKWYDNHFLERRSKLIH